MNKHGVAIGAIFTVVALALLSGCSSTRYADESSDLMTRYRGDCNGRVEVDYEYTLASDNKDNEGARREVRCEPDLHQPMPNSGPRVESPIERG